ncbi:MAG: hypothetical protein ABIS36_13370 [Chryseolinea sp.]
MKIRKNIANALLIVGAMVTSQVFAQQADSTGLPGDNFSLAGALEMFKKAESPEKFEQMINTQDNNVNNLDLNGDGDIDYIKVIDKRDGDAHAIILQDVVSDSESQDIAVIEIEKESDGKASLQIVGDADIYGEEMIVEPKSEQVSTVPQPQSAAPVSVNVWAWPSVRYVYGPGYAMWVSPWGWRARPVWWRPWRPVRYSAFYPYRVPYYNRYVVVNRHTVIHAHRVYAPVRTTSVIVQTRHQPAVSDYRATRKTTVVTGRNGHVRGVQKTTTVKGRKGSVSKTTRVRRRH